MSLYGVGLDVEVKRIHLKMKLALSKRSSCGIGGLRNSFKCMDKDGTGKLCVKTFESALADFGLFTTVTELQALHKFYDKSGDGSVCYGSFLCAFRQPLSKARYELVLEAFKQFDKDGCGEIDCKDLVEGFDATSYADFYNGKKTKNQLVQDFLGQFDGGKTEGKITLDEFVNYYTDLSVGIPSDHFFNDLLCKTWKVTKKDRQEVSKQELSMIVKTLREKLIQKTNGAHDELYMQDIFREFDLNQSGQLTADELYAMLLQLEIPVHKKYLCALLKCFDRSGDGQISFEEFMNYVLYNPYK